MSRCSIEILGSEVGIRCNAFGFESDSLCSTLCSVAVDDAVAHIVSSCDSIYEKQMWARIGLTTSKNQEFELSIRRGPVVKVLSRLLAVSDRICQPTATSGIWAITQLFGLYGPMISYG